MNGYVAAGWSVTAVVLALYTWRLIRRGHLLTRALPDEPVAAGSPPARSSTPVGDPAVSPSVDPSPDGATTEERAATVAAPSPEVGAWQ